MDTSKLHQAIDDITQRLAALKLMLAEFETQKEPAFPDWAREKVDNRVCLVCGERIAENEHVHRGSHQAHAKRVMRAVSNGEYTEFQAIELGLLAPKTPPGRKPSPIPLDPRVQQEADEAAAKLRKRANKNP